jgi:hypothetical protein
MHRHELHELSTNFQKTTDGNDGTDQTTSGDFRVAASISVNL